MALFLAFITGLVFYARFTNDKPEVVVYLRIDTNPVQIDPDIVMKPPYNTVPVPALSSATTISVSLYDYCRRFATNEGAVLPDICDVYLADLCPELDEFCSDGTTLREPGSLQTTTPSTVAPPVTLPPSLDLMDPGN